MGDPSTPISDGSREGAGRGACQIVANSLNQGLGGNLKQISKIANFKRDYLNAISDSEFTVKTKNAPFFMNFPNIYKLWQNSSRWPRYPQKTVSEYTCSLKSSQCHVIL
jgi:hypothetical protein